MYTLSSSRTLYSLYHNLLNIIHLFCFSGFLARSASCTCIFLIEYELFINKYIFVTIWRPFHNPCLISTPFYISGFSLSIFFFFFFRREEFSIRKNLVELTFSLAFSVSIFAHPPHLTRSSWQAVTITKEKRNEKLAFNDESGKQRDWA